MAVNNTSLLFPHPNATTATDFLLVYPNEQLLPGFYGYLLLVMVFAITFLNLVQRVDPRKAFAASSYVTFIIAVLSVPLGILGADGWVVAFILLIVAVMLSKTGRGV